MILLFNNRTFFDKHSSGTFASKHVIVKKGMKRACRFPNESYRLVRLWDIIIRPRGAQRGCVLAYVSRYVVFVCMFIVTLICAATLQYCHGSDTEGWRSDGSPAIPYLQKRDPHIPSRYCISLSTSLAHFASLCYPGDVHALSFISG